MSVVTKPRLLDLFCGAGGAAKGYQRAGFHVTGVDIVDQPRYCGDEFVRADAAEDFAAIWNTYGGFDAIHASPPCQAYTTMGQRFAETQAAHPDLIAATRRLLIQSGLPYVIENVMGARDQLRQPIRLCGKSLGLGLHRHRLFETNFSVMAPPCVDDGKPSAAVYGKNDQRRLWTRTDGTELRAATLEEAQEAMDIDWMDWDEIREAIPPTMTELLGHQLLQALKYQEAA